MTKLPSIVNPERESSLDSKDIAKVSLKQNFLLSTVEGAELKFGHVWW